MHAGSVVDIRQGSGQWAFVDIGFAREDKTGALLVHDGAPRLLTFAELGRNLAGLASEVDAPLHLVLEAPLSVAFTSSGNPAGRSLEKSDAGHRYWYAGLGCQVTVAAAYLLREMLAAKPTRPIRLYEAFVSFKTAKSSHARDVVAMRSVAWQQSGYAGHVVPAEQLAGPHAVLVQSAFTVFGFDLGIPPVIVANAT